MLRIRRKSILSAEESLSPVLQNYRVRPDLSNNLPDLSMSLGQKNVCSEKSTSLSRSRWLYSSLSAQF